MDHPTTKKSKTTIPNDAIGLNSQNLGDSDINSATWRFVALQKEPAVGKGEIGKTQTMRTRILQLSLFPDIYDKVKYVKNPGNVDFGDHDVY